MSDNLKNQGWKEMSKLLDIHMPVEKKRSIFLPWYYNAAAGLLLITGVYLLNQKANFVSKTSEVAQADSTIQSYGVEKNAGPVLQAENISLGMQNHIARISSLSTSNKVSIDELNKVVSLYHTNQYSKNVELSESAIAKKTFSEGAVVKENYDFVKPSETPQSSIGFSSFSDGNIIGKNLSSTSQSNNSVAVSNLLNTTSSANDPFVSNEISLDENIDTKTNVAIIETKEMEKTQAPMDEIAEVIKKEKNNKIFLAPFVSGFVNLNNKTFGKSAGLDVGFRKNDWSILIGGEIMSNNIVGLTSSELTNYGNTSSTSFGKNTIPMLPTLTARTYNVKMDKIESINLKLEYKLTDKLSIFSGVNRNTTSGIAKEVYGINYEQREQNTNPNGTLNDVINLKQAEKQNIIEYLNKIQSNSINSTNVITSSKFKGYSYMAGLSYSILKKLKINLGFRSNFKPKNSFSDYASDNDKPLITIGAAYTAL
jgi:opacity protein-like surface antigen